MRYELTNNEVGEALMDYLEKRRGVDLEPGDQIIVRVQDSKSEVEMVHTFTLTKPAKGRPE